MIISRTPLRVSFVGGGTDFKDYYQRKGGAVVSTTITKYIYVIINQNFDDSIQLNYGTSETTGSIDNIRQGIMRECLRMAGVEKGIQITIVSDIPGGTGLGSSSSLTVGLLNALFAYTGRSISPDNLAKRACEVEIDILKEPIGKQDQYIAAYGGLKYIQFNPDETTAVQSIPLPSSVKKMFEQRCMMFYTGSTRKSSSILAEQKQKIVHNYDHLDQMRNLTIEFRELVQKQKIDEVGMLLHRNWMLKKQLAEGVSNKLIDEYYQKAIDAGAIGGKLLGAGGGGFLLIYAKENNQQYIREALSELMEIKFKMEPSGSTIIYADN